MGRGAVAITVMSDAGDPVQLVTTHLKSKLLTFPHGRFEPRDEDERARFAAYALYRRAAEATTLRVWVTAALMNDGQNRRLILTGDLNDTMQAATTQLLLGPPGSEIGTASFDRPDKGDSRRLWNLAPLMPEGKNYSRIFEGRKELIDHILVSAALVKPLKLDRNRIGRRKSALINYYQRECPPRPTKFGPCSRCRDLRGPLIRQQCRRRAPEPSSSRARRPTVFVEAVVRWRALGARGVPNETSPATSSWRTAATEPSDRLGRPKPR